MKCIKTTAIKKWVILLLIITFAHNALAAAKKKPAPNARERKIPLSDATSTWGYYGVTPESPDEKRLCYALYPEPSKSASDVKYPDAPAELWVCNIDGTGHRRLFKGHSKFHNGLTPTPVR